MLGKASFPFLFSFGIAFLALVATGCSKPTEADGPKKKSAAEKMVENSEPPLEERERIAEMKVELHAKVRTDTQGWPTEINLSGTEFSDDRAYLLPGWKDLEVINLADTDITDKSLEKLAENTKLRQVLLARTKVTDAGLAYLVNNPALYWLDLTGTGVTNDGLSHVAKLTSLTRLDLTGTQVTANGILNHLKSMGRLQKVLLAPGQFSDVELSNLREQMKTTTFY